jgi:TM2 domain-containing membrane protein YozV
MKKSTKAALLSGLVFPGVGQMYLKRFGRGLLFMVPVLFGVAIIVAMATIGAMESLKTIQAQGGIVDSNAITAAAQIHAKETAGYFRAILLFIVICWLAAIVDAYRLGSKQMLEGK